MSVTWCGTPGLAADFLFLPPGVDPGARPGRAQRTSNATAVRRSAVLALSPTPARGRISAPGAGRSSARGLDPSRLPCMPICSPTHQSLACATFAFRIAQSFEGRFWRREIRPVRCGSSSLETPDRTRPARRGSNSMRARTSPPGVGKRTRHPLGQWLPDHHPRTRPQCSSSPSSTTNSCSVTPRRRPDRRVDGELLAPRVWTMTRTWWSFVGTGGSRTSISPSSPALLHYYFRSVVESRSRTDRAGRGRRHLRRSI